MASIIPKIRKNLLRNLKIIGVVLLAVLFVSLVITFVWNYVDETRIEFITSETVIEIWNQTRYDSPVEAFVNKGFFDSVGQVYAYLNSPYANYWGNFSAWVSLDNASWVSLPFLESVTSNRTEMANLGFISLSNPQLTVYLKHYVPPQTVPLPPNVTKEDASILTVHILVKKETTAADKTQWILVFSTVFGVILAIVLFMRNVFGEKTIRKKRKAKKR
jgi:hypothetical protein